MNPLAWLVSFIMPACGFAGAGGLPPPTLMDMTHVARPTTPNTALAAPAGFRPTPDIVTPTYKVPPDRLFAAIESVAGAQPRTFPAATFAPERQVHYVARSAMFNFPDLITVQVAPAPPDGATLVLWSRSVYGESDLGVNRKRVVAWLAALDAVLNLPPER
jgi:uncharacterized protein (DUF1499 family)